MPYVAIKCYPKDEEVKKKMIEGINQVILDAVGCPQKAITISYEEFTPEEFAVKVREPEIIPNEDKMMILSGEKRY